MRNRLGQLWSDECGITTVEYALLLALVSVASLVAWTTLGQRKTQMLTIVNERMGP